MDYGSTEVKLGFWYNTEGVITFTYGELHRTEHPESGLQQNTGLLLD